MQQKGTMAQFEAEVRDIKMNGIYKDAVAGHGEKHIENVLFNAMNIAEMEHLDDTERRLLIEAAKYHDAGKNVEGILHGVTGAKKAAESLSEIDPDDIAIIQAAIEYHSIPDSEEKLQEIFKKYGVASGDTSIAKRVANALKDADALDRSRFPGNLNENYLRTESAKSLVKATHQIQEVEGKAFLDELLSSNLSSNDRKIIEKLRKTPLSDYEIAFWIQYQPSQIGGTMRVWKQINDKIQGMI